MCMKRRLIIVALALAETLSANAQYTFQSITVAGSGSSSKATTILTWGPYGTREMCEQKRREVEIANSWSEPILGGRIESKTRTTPCSGPGGSTGSVDVLGISKGSSFYSTNPVNEINDWSNDDMDRMLALNPNFANASATELSMGSPEADRARNQARESVFVLDTSKPFRSLNIGKEGEYLTSSPDLDMFESIWQMEKKSRGIPYETVEEYKKHRLEEALSLISKLQSLFNMNADDLVTNLSVIETNLRIALQGCEEDYKKQSDMLEKILQLAEYKVEYKNIMLMDYMDKHPQNPDPKGADWEKLGTWLAKVVPTPWMKEYQEKYGEWDKKYLEGREKELIETYGVSKQDIEALKLNIDNDTFIADIASATSGLFGGARDANQLMWIYNDKSKSFIDGFLKTGKEMIPMVVVATDWAKVKDYESQRDLIKKKKEELDNEYRTIKSNLEEKKGKANALSYLLDVTVHNNIESSSKMSRKEQLNLANRIGEAIESVHEYSDINNSNRRREGTFIEYRGK